MNLCFWFEDDDLVFFVLSLLNGDLQVLVHDLRVVTLKFWSGKLLDKAFVVERILSRIVTQLFHGNWRVFIFIFDKLLSVFLLVQSLLHTFVKILLFPHFFYFLLFLLQLTCIFQDPHQLIIPFPQFHLLMPRKDLSVLVRKLCHLIEPNVQKVVENRAYIERPM